MKNLVLISVASLSLAGCEPAPGTQSVTDSPGMNTAASFMGTVDGCRLWSVNAGQFYFANCRSGVTSTGWSRTSGKTRHYYTASTEPEFRP